MSISEIIGGVLAVLGSLVFIAAALGLSRFPDPYMRNAAVGTVAGLGIALVTLGAAIVHPKVGTIAIALLAIVLQLITSALGAMLVGRAAVNSHHQFCPETDTTDLGWVPRIGDEDSEAPSGLQEAEAANGLQEAGAGTDRARGRDGKRPGREDPPRR
ncbi:cation:proton antiporter [Brachybacterium sp. AOP43-C2-M15]|uniref:cation:proton antiporter n=1 Tax=Brachybacterium sp. AOP43-C2-M15 TaxID=3457661 RepID=UPI0040341AA3